MKDLLSRFRLPSAPVPTPTARPRIDEVFGTTSTAYPADVLFGGVGGAEKGSRRLGIPVSSSRDLARVLELPRRPRMTPEEGEYISQVLTARLGKGDVECVCQSQYHSRCAKTLRPTQAWALDEAEANEGLLGPISVGDGKTLLNLLTPMVMPNCKTALLLLPPDLRGQLDKEWGFYAQHWHLPNLTTGRWAVPGRPWLHIVSFSVLSLATSTELLTQIKPDLIIVDEAHNLRRRDAVRTKRFLHYMHSHPETRLCAWSGTLTSRSLKDYAHLANLALKERSPTPLLWPVVEEWAGAIDPGDFPTPIGQLAQFCQPGEHLHVGWKRRLHETPGVVSSGDVANCNASLLFTERKVTAPAEVTQAILKIRLNAQRPDGEELVSALDVARCARELASGFYYRWTWPRGEPEEVIRRWLEVRAAWHKELREKLKHSRPHMDSPLLLAKAAIRYYQTPSYEGDLPTWASKHWQEWAEVRDTASPVTETVWVSDYLVADAAEWCHTEGKHGGIVWYEHAAFGEAVAAKAGVPFYGPGEEASAGIIREDGSRPVVASIRSHHKGKNLQMFSKQLVANPPSDGATWEQLVGRTHRYGQNADEVRVAVYRHVEEMREALDKARLLAAYIDDTMGGAKKMLRATFSFL